MNSRERFLAACQNETVDRPPVWLMRQAGRYLPEYRALREKHNFWDMVKTPELAVEATLQPIRRYDMDAGILFSDILVVLDAMGVDVRYEEGGPVLNPHVKSADEFKKLRSSVNTSAFEYMGKAVEGLCRELHPGHAVIGFAGAPFTLAAYLVEGGPSKQVTALKTLAYRQPGLYMDIANSIADIVAGLLKVQIEAGADVVQIFDTWAAHLSPDEYAELALPYTKKVVEQLAGLKVPVIVYIRNAAGLLEEAAKSGCDLISIDSTLRLKDARKRLDRRIGLQGNFDPALLTAPADIIRTRVGEAITDMRGTGYIVNLGQGLMPSSPVEGVAEFVKAVKEGGR